MELEISERTAVVPKNYVGQNVMFMIEKDPETGDCIKATERESKKNGGKFTQYTLFLKTKDNEKFEVNFLFARDLKKLVLQYGKDTTGWNQCGVEVTGSPREEGDQLFYDIVLTPKTLPPEWLTKNVA